MKKLIISLGIILMSMNLMASNCQKKGTVIGDNHSITVYKCSKFFKVKASNDAVSRNFDGLELKLIRKIFKTANTKHSSFKNKQTLYNSNGLEITVRLYSTSEWFLIFKFGKSTQQAHVWIPANKLNKFESLLH